MKCLVSLFHVESVREEYVVFDNMQYEVKTFDMSFSFSYLIWWIKEKFEGDFILKGRFNSGKTRTYYVLMPLCNESH
jgi:hypothetical protein